MKMKNTFISLLVLGAMFLFFWTPVAHSQEVKINLDESTYGISADMLKNVANVLIKKQFPYLIDKSWRIQTNLKAVGEDYKRRALNYEMIVFFLHKKTYKAEVKKVSFSLVNGETKQVAVVDYPLKKLDIIKKIRPIPDCKKKQGLLIKPQGLIEMKPVKPAEAKRIEMDPQVLRRSEFSLDKWWYTNGLATTPCDYIPTAVSGTKGVYKTFGNAFGKGNAAMRVGKDCTVKMVSSYLKYDSKLLGWNHIGHGWPGGIALWDNSLEASTVQNLTPHNGIYCAVALINSCNTFNDPLKAAFLSNSPRTFIAGAISLPIGTSEEVDRCFWKEVLLNKKRMDKSLAYCSKQMNLAGAFGLAGDGGFFW